MCLLLNVRMSIIGKNRKLLKSIIGKCIYIIIGIIVSGLYCPDGLSDKRLIIKIIIKVLLNMNNI